MSWSDRGPGDLNWTVTTIKTEWRKAGPPCGECGEPLGPGGGLPVWHHLATGEDKRQELCAACAARGRVEGWVLPDPDADEGGAW